MQCEKKVCWGDTCFLLRGAIPVAQRLTLLVPFSSSGIGDYEVRCHFTYEDVIDLKNKGSKTGRIIFQKGVGHSLLSSSLG